MKELFINLRLFPDENLDFEGLDDDILDDEEGEEIPPEDKKPEEEETEEEKKKWFMPGIAKTQKDAMKLYKKNQQVIRQVQEKNSQLANQVKDIVPPIPAGAPAQRDDYDEAIVALGITENDWLLKPQETNKRVMQYYMKNVIPKQVMQPILNETGDIKAGILRRELKRQYPDFDLVSQEKKVSEIARRLYNADNIRRNPLKVFGAVLESLGAVKRKAVKKTDEPFTEQPNGGSHITQATKKTADGIRERMLKVAKGNGLFK